MTRKQVHFHHEGQDYFIALPDIRAVSGDLFHELFEILAAHGIYTVYDVEEDVKGRYQTIYVNQSLRALEGSAELPAGVELRYGHTAPYLYIAQTLTIISHDPDFIALVDKVWKENNPRIAP